MKYERQCFITIVKKGKRVENMAYSGRIGNMSKHGLKYFTTGCPSSKYMVYAAACVCRELYEKITDRKKKLCKSQSKLSLRKILENITIPKNLHVAN